MWNLRRFNEVGALAHLDEAIATINQRDMAFPESDRGEGDELRWWQVCDRARQGKFAEAEAAFERAASIVEGRPATSKAHPSTAYALFTEGISLARRRKEPKVAAARALRFLNRCLRDDMVGRAWERSFVGVALSEWHDTCPGPPSPSLRSQVRSWLRCIRNLPNHRFHHLTPEVIAHLGLRPTDLPRHR